MTGAMEHVDIVSTSSIVHRIRTPQPDKRWLVEREACWSVDGGVGVGVGSGGVLLLVEC